MVDYDGVFAEYYDLLNSQKEYSVEASEIVKAIKLYYTGKGGELADVGCGTGNYSILFENHGFQVSGYDIASAMIDKAKQKVSNVNFENMDFVHITRKFDIITAMFNVVNALPDYDSLIVFFRSITKSLKPDSLFIFDSWNGIAVFRKPPVVKTKVIEVSDLKIIRDVIPDNNLFEQFSNHDYKIKIYRNEEEIGNFSSMFHNSFYTFQETNRALDASGLEIIKSFPYKNLEREVREDDFIITYICKIKTIQ